MRLVGTIGMLLLETALVLGEGEAIRPTLSLNQDEFTKMAVDRSLQSRANEENLQNSRWSWLAQQRRLTWPTVTAGHAIFA